MDQFEDVYCIGGGAYGRVYSARRTSDDRRVAIKKVKSSGSRGVHSTTIREIGILKQLNHPNIVKLLDVVPARKSVLMVFEYMDLDLKRFLALNHPRIERAVIRLVQGVACLHSKRILHRDLKSQNILLDKQHLTAKIADFGLARMFSLPSRPYTREVVTLWYRAPEILLGMGTYGCPVDMWSLGCIFVEMMMGRVLWKGQSEIDQLLKIFETLGTPTEAIWPGVNRLPFYISKCPRWIPRSLESVTGVSDPLALDLMSKLLTYDPQKRITAEAALIHPFFREEQSVSEDRALRPITATNR